MNYDSVRKQRFFGAMEESMYIILKTIKHKKCMDEAKLYSLQYYWACLQKNRLCYPQWNFSNFFSNRH